MSTTGGKDPSQPDSGPFTPLARAMGESAVMACMLLDARGRIVAANPGAAAVLGLPRQPAPGQDASVLFPPAERTRFESLAGECLSTGAPRTAVLTVSRGDGDRLILAASFLPLPDAVPEGPSLAFLGRDITPEHEETEKLRRGTLDVIRLNAELRQISTARQMAVQALEELSGRLKGVLEAASRVVIVATSVSGVITMFNPGAANLLGYAPDEMEGVQTPLAFLDEDEVAARGRELGGTGGKPLAGMTVVTALARSGRRDFGEWTLVRKDGSRFAAEVALSSIEGPHGVEGYLLVGVDVSGRKMAEEATAEREARLRAILNGAGEGIVTVDRDGVIESANPAAEAMFGYPPGGLAGRPFEDMVPGTQGRAASGGAVMEASGARLSGGRFPVELTVSEVEVSSRILRTFIIRDITARRRAEEAKRLYTKRLASQQAALERDLRAAAEIQKGLLPRNLPEDARYHASWLFEPSAAIGGDIFNILILGPDLVAAYILDVSGHGVPSALVAAAAAQALQFHSREWDPSAGGGPAPEKVLEALDEEFPMERFDRYFSLFYLTLDLKSGRLRYSNAGHPPPFLARDGGGLERLEAGGTVVGLGGLMPFERGEAVLAPGDRLVMFTDGVTEFESAKGSAFGVKRLQRWIAAGKATKALMADIRRFGGRTRPQDDLTVLALGYNGPEGRGESHDGG